MRHIYKVVQVRDLLEMGRLGSKKSRCKTVRKSNMLKTVVQRINISEIITNQLKTKSLRWLLGFT
jgi:hypothetical protein